MDSLFEAIELLDSDWVFASFERLSVIRNLLLRANRTTVDWLSAFWVKGSPVAAIPTIVNVDKGICLLR